jgi:hypothetical protein
VISLACILLKSTGIYPQSSGGEKNMAESLEDKIARNETKIIYKEYVIWLGSYALQSGGWTPRALVVVPAAAGNGEQEILMPGGGTVATREEADSQALAMSQQWIDEHVTGQHKERTMP